MSGWPLCQCPAGQAPCGKEITQEDLLCDKCRRGDCGRLDAERRVVLKELRDANGVIVAEGWP